MRPADRGLWDSPYAQAMVQQVSLALLVTVLVGGCGQSQPSDDTGAAPTPDPPSATATVSGEENPCLQEGGPAEPPDARPGTDAYLGLTKDEAERYARAHGQTVRVAGRDGECFALTMDYRDDRVNIYLEDDQIVAATVG
jgi:hypothetical protein